MVASTCSKRVMNIHISNIGNNKSCVERRFIFKNLSLIFGVSLIFIGYISLLRCCYTNVFALCVCRLSIGYRMKRFFLILPIYIRDDNESVVVLDSYFVGASRCAFSHIFHQEIRKIFSWTKKLTSFITAAARRIDIQDGIMYIYAVVE